MKQLILLFTLIFTVGVFAADKNKSVTLTVSGMTCESCANTVEKALKKVDGVKEAKVNLSEKTATVVLASSKTTTTLLIKAVTDAGFSASAGTSTSKTEMKKKNGNKEECGNGCCDDGSGVESKPKKGVKKS
ncbi:MAG: heavy metal-associated domain-containing protein [Bacteroidota bacterium]